MPLFQVKIFGFVQERKKEGGNNGVCVGGGITATSDTSSGGAGTNWCPRKDWVTAISSLPCLFNTESPQECPCSAKICIRHCSQPSQFSSIAYKVTPPINKCPCSAKICVKATTPGREEEEEEEEKREKKDIPPVEFNRNLARKKKKKKHPKKAIFHVLIIIIEKEKIGSVSNPFFSSFLF